MSSRTAWILRGVATCSEPCLHVEIWATDCTRTPSSPPSTNFLHQTASPGARLLSIRKRCYFLSQVFVLSTPGTSAWTFWFLYEVGSSETQATQRADSRGGVPNWYGDDYECIAGGKAWQAGRCGRKLQLPPHPGPPAEHLDGPARLCGRQLPSEVLRSSEGQIPPRGR